MLPQGVGSRFQLDAAGTGVTVGVGQQGGGGSCQPVGKVWFRPISPVADELSGLDQAWLSDLELVPPGLVRML